jgi:molybdopterin-guanine dinucleotide biosynthesis protein B
MMKVVAIVGRSGAGKTTLIENLIAIFRRRGLRVSAVKHTHHDIEIDHVGKDSWRLKQAGAFEVALVSPSSMSLQRTFENNFSMSIHQVLAQMYEGIDWVLVEGFKGSDIVKLEVVDTEKNSQNLICHSDDFVAAIAYTSCDGVNLESSLPMLPRDEPEVVADWLMAHQDRFSYSLPLL